MKSSTDELNEVSKQIAFEYKKKNFYSNHIST